jgi:NADP-reducing hydrogenase subunit HndB
MKIESLEQLQQIKNEYQQKIVLRQDSSGHEHDFSNSHGGRIEILVGMATCGISAGARDTLNAFQKELDRQGIKDARVIPVGCIGCCYAEPTVQINIQGEKPVLYGHLKKERVEEVVRSHLQQGVPVKDLIIPMNFARA